MLKYSVFFFLMIFSGLSISMDKVEFFVGPECPQCDQARLTLTDYQKAIPELIIQEINIFSTPENSERLRYLVAKEGLTNVELPIFYYHSTLRSGFREPQALINWVNEIKANINPVSEISFLGMTVTNEKNGSPCFAFILGVKDFFFSFYGLAMLMITTLIAFSFYRMDGLVSLFAVYLGALISGVFWSEPSSRLIFERYGMIDLYGAAIVLVLCAFLIIKNKFRPLGGWQELGFLSVGMIIQRLAVIITRPEIIRLQDTLFEAGTEGVQQLGINIVYSFTQFLIAVIVLIIFKQLKKN